MSKTRYVTPQVWSIDSPDPTPFGLEWEEAQGKNDPAQRFALYRLCQCEECGGSGKEDIDTSSLSAISTSRERCRECRGEGRTLEVIATCGTPEELGLALVTLAREEEFSECPIGVLDRMGEVGQKWLITPWLPSPRNASDAGRLLRSRRKGEA